MKVYVAVVNDRHADPEVTVYADEGEAIKYARGQAKEGAHEESDYEEHPVNDAMQRLGWVFYASYSEESDSVWVVETELKMKTEEQQRWDKYWGM